MFFPFHCSTELFTSISYICGPFLPHSLPCSLLMISFPLHFQLLDPSPSIPRDTVSEQDAQVPLHVRRSGLQRIIQCRRLLTGRRSGLSDSAEGDVSCLIFHLFVHFIPFFPPFPLKQHSICGLYWWLHRVESQRQSERDSGLWSQCSDRCMFAGFEERLVETRELFFPCIF